MGVFVLHAADDHARGMETALLMTQLLFTVKSTQIIAGAVSGTLSAAFVAWLWSRYGYRVNLSRFFQVTAVFLLVFVVQLLIYGFHELDRSQHLPEQPAAARRDRAVRARRHLRPVPDLSARAAAARLAGGRELAASRRASQPRAPRSTQPGGADPELAKRAVLDSSRPTFRLRLDIA